MEYIISKEIGRIQQEEYFTIKVKTGLIDKYGEDINITLKISDSDYMRLLYYYSETDDPENEHFKKADCSEMFIFFNNLIKGGDK